MERGVRCHLRFRSPGGGPPDHYHAEHDELFYLLEGELTFSEADRDFTARSGDLVLIKRARVLLRIVRKTLAWQERSRE
ncbi:cupin domain-containing protein [Nocardiopsis eucommiae]|uniref:Cupin domain-containing protein n=1 Tax=Nocardiopsis eucommiae TaxID=2831970 RepID=A0A975LDT6_9ACTN|nr:cupin domain-containing protein [Nocardiopsis eucommiae]